MRFRNDEEGAKLRRPQQRQQQSSMTAFKNVQRLQLGDFILYYSLVSHQGPDARLALRLQQTVHISIHLPDWSTIFFESHIKKKVSKKFSSLQIVCFGAQQTRAYALYPGRSSEFGWMARFDYVALNNCRCCRWVLLHRCNHLRFSPKHFCGAALSCTLISPWTCARFCWEPNGNYCMALAVINSLGDAMHIQFNWCRPLSFAIRSRFESDHRLWNCISKLFGCRLLHQ